MAPKAQKINQISMSCLETQS